MSEKDRDTSNAYLELLNLTEVSDVIDHIKELSSDLTDTEHKIRSSIFDLHAALEFELQRMFYHIFYPMLFLTNEEKQRQDTNAKFERRIEKLGYMEMYRVLEPVFVSWPLGDLDAFLAIDKTRNQVGHAADVKDVRYKGRNPFTNTDCFAQMYFDVWAAQQAAAKFFDRAISGPRETLKRYQKKFEWWLFSIINDDDFNGWTLICCSDN